MHARTSSRHAVATTRGFALPIALLVLALAAVVALASARGAAFGSRIASAAAHRFEIRSVADNALERAIAARLPAGESVAATTATDGEYRVTTEVRRDRRTPLGMPPLDGFSLGLGGAAFGAEHYTARATAISSRAGRATLEQQFFLLVPEGP